MSTESPAPSPNAPPPWSGEARRALDQRMYLALDKARRALYGRMRPFLRGHGLTETQWYVLRLVNEIPHSSHRSLRRLTGLEGSTMGCVIEALVRKAFIVRKRRRAKYIRGIHVVLEKRRYEMEITPRGNAMLRQALRESDMRYLDAEPRFAEDDLDRLYALLQGFAEALSGVRDAPTDEAYDPYRREHWRDMPRHPTRGHFVARAGSVPRPKRPKPKIPSKRELDRLAGVHFETREDLAQLNARLKGRRTRGADGTDA